jgi:hypothetical protein
VRVSDESVFYVWCKLGIHNCKSESSIYLRGLKNFPVKVLSRTSNVKKERMYDESMIYCDEEATCT